MMEMKWNDIQFHVTSIFWRKPVAFCIQMGKLLLNVLNHHFGNGLLAFLPVILHAIFPDFTASWMTMTMPYFSAYPVWPGQCLTIDRPPQMWSPCCSEVWGLRTQRALIGSYFSSSLHDSAGVSKGQCSKQTNKQKMCMCQLTF